MTIRNHRFESVLKGLGLFSAALFCLGVAGCATQSIENQARGPAVDPKLGVAPSPVVAVADTEQALASGGGRYHVGKPYQIAGRWYRPTVNPSYERVGIASWYGRAFHGRLTANGETFDMNALTAAHPTMPLPSYARVTNLENDRSVIVRVNDRGPFAHNRLIDLSKQTARLLGFVQNGTAKVRVEYVGKAPLDGQDRNYLLASYRGPAVPDGTEERPIVVAQALAPRSRADQLSAEILASGTAFDPYLALTDSQGKLVATQRFGAMPASQAGFDTPTPLPEGQLVKPS